MSQAGSEDGAHTNAVLAISVDKPPKSSLIRAWIVRSGKRYQTSLTVSLVVSFVNENMSSLNLPDAVSKAANSVF